MNVLLSMSVFKRVVETESFSVVARELGLSQPTVSKHVATLEEYLSIKLLRRNTRRLSLTEVGKQYYEQCRQILDQLSEIEVNIRNQQSRPTGTLRLNTPITYGELQIIPLIWKFLARYPELNIDLVMDDHYVDVIKEGVDLAIRVGPLNSSSLIAMKIGSYSRFTVAGKNYLASHGEPERPGDLKFHQCILFTLMSDQNEWHYTGPAGKETVQVNGRFSVNNATAMREAVVQNLGIAIVPLWLIKDYLEQGKVKIILKNHTPDPMAIHALYPERRYVPAKVRCFIDFLKEEINKTGFSI